MESGELDFLHGPQGQVFQLLKQETCCLRSNEAPLQTSTDYTGSQTIQFMGRWIGPHLVMVEWSRSRRTWDRRWCHSCALNSSFPTSLLIPRQRTNSPPCTEIHMGVKWHLKWSLPSSFVLPISVLLGEKPVCCVLDKYARSNLPQNVSRWKKRTQCSMDVTCNLRDSVP